MGTKYTKVFCVGIELVITLGGFTLPERHVSTSPAANKDPNAFLLKFCFSKGNYRVNEITSNTV